MKFSVPAGDGECLFHPPRDRVPETIELNHSLLESYDFRVAGKHFCDLRAAARHNLAEGIARCLPAQPTIVAGAHQPGFHGPGILFKHEVLQSFSRGRFCVNFVVDSDVSKRVSAKVPHLRGNVIRLEEVVIFPNPGNLVFESLSVPPKAQVNLSYDRIEKLLESLQTDDTLTAFREFRAVHEAVYSEGDSAASVLTRYRQGYYPTPGVHESYISIMSRSPQFLAYALDLMVNIERFHLAHNSSLIEHRQLHRIRTLANPFPDLRRQGELWELPFWSVDDAGKRRKMFAARSKTRRFVEVEGLARRISDADPDALLSLRVRPRAVCLTMFLRLFVADLFVHGVGGGNYDQATDRIIQKYYGVSPPEYIVCSRTRFLGGHQTAELQEKATELRQTLRHMNHNPERFAPPNDSLVRNALRILSESRGKPSASQHVHLRQLRQAITERIAPQVASVQKEIAQVQSALHRRAALNRRDFPYFLFPRFQL